MQRKSCSNCGIPANFSFCFLASTVGQSPRIQGAATAVLFCNACLEALAGAEQAEPLSGIKRSVIEAWKALARGTARGQHLENPAFSTGLERRAG
jgi:hypothetical protein